MNDPNPVLLVEDNEDDVFLMRRALNQAGLAFPVHVALDGQQALDYLRGIDPDHNGSSAPLPGVIFLDLKLPYVHGFEVLAWLRDQPLLSQIPVVILTSSPEERDRQHAVELGAKAYLVKPPTPEMLRHVLRSVNDPVPGGW